MEDITGMLDTGYLQRGAAKTSKQEAQRDVGGRVSDTKRSRVAKRR